METKRIIRKVIDTAKLISWSIAVFFYYFQVPFMEYSWLITTGVASFLFFSVKNIIKLVNEKNYVVYFYIFLLILCLINAACSIYMGSDFTNVIRFFLIVVLIPIIPSFVDGETRYIYGVFSILSICKAVMIISIAYIVFTTGSFAELRLWAQSNQYGDIYSIYNNIPRVQLKGNALLVVAFMISFVKNRKITLYNCILLTSILFAGNFAFVLALVIFFIWQYVKQISLQISIKSIIVSILIFLSFIGFIQYTSLEIESKSGSPNSSNAHRIQQIEILADTNYLLGNGLGSIVKESTNIGVPIDSKYYEVQTMYIFFQVGAIILCLFYIVLFIMAKNHYNYNGKMILVIYLIYSFFNPYCFDSTQMIAMILIAMKFPI